jgi:hypothetical protein
MDSFIDCPPCQLTIYRRAEQTLYVPSSAYDTCELFEQHFVTYQHFLRMLGRHATHYLPIMKKFVGDIVVSERVHELAES